VVDGLDVPISHLAVIAADAGRSASRYRAKAKTCQARAKSHTAKAKAQQSPIGAGAHEDTAKAAMLEAKQWTERARDADTCKVQTKAALAILAQAAKGAV